MDKTKMPYRQAVLALVIDGDNNFLIVQLNEFADDEWKFISGGLNPSFLSGSLPILNTLSL